MTGAIIFVVFLCLCVLGLGVIGLVAINQRDRYKAALKWIVKCQVGAGFAGMDINNEAHLAIAANLAHEAQVASIKQTAQAALDNEEILPGDPSA